jgi:APA family basic amino acid/polyamine antiporter
MSWMATPHEGPSTGEPAPAGFQQRLGLFDATMLVAGSMIGSGIFIVSADIARDVGSTGWLMAVWVLTGIMTVIGALSYGELAAMMPLAGGQYIYLREAYSPLWGFLYGWTLFLVIQTGTIAAVAVAFGKFLGILAPQLGPENILLTIPYSWPSMQDQTLVFRPKELSIAASHCVGVGIVVFLTLLNCRGVREGKWVQNIFTVSKTLALLLLIVLGLTVAVNKGAIEANWHDLWTGARDTKAYHQLYDPGAAGLAERSASPTLLGLWSGLAILMVAGGAMVGSLFSADAWNNVTFTAGEVRNPRRNLPLSLALGTMLVITLYVLANVAYLVTLPVRGDEQLAKQLETELKAAKTPEEKATVEAKYVENVERLGIAHAQADRVATASLLQAKLHFAIPFLAIAIMVSSFGCVNGLILMGARLYYAMAQDGLFFRAVGRLNSRSVPAAGLVLQGVWASLLIFSGTYGQLLDYVIFAALLFYVLTVVGLFVLRRTRPDAPRPYRAFGYPIIPAVYVVLCALIMVDLLKVRPEYTWPGLIIVLTGIPVYFLWRVFGRGASVSKKLTE